jgi:uncharacterized protein
MEFMMSATTASATVPEPASTAGRPPRPPGWRAAESPFHDGERIAQERAGVRERMEVDARRGIRDYMPEQHRQFFAQLPFMVFGALDENGRPWASLRYGDPGFVSTPDEHTLRLTGRTPVGDPLAHAWQVGAMVGGLGIQPATRRRNRVNGVITAIDGDAITVTVSQSYGNCAKYIQSRTPTYDAAAELDAWTETPEVSPVLSDADRALIARADTLFIASANAASEAGLARGVDVSHRGGKPGFVRIDVDGTLTLPDFSGNLFFNTIGNLLQNPQAGLLIPDFESGDLVFIAVDGEIVWEGTELKSFTGAERLMRFHVREVRRSRHALPFRWSAAEYAPQLANLGSWDAKPAASVAADAWRKLKVVEVRDETSTARSFYLRNADGSPLPRFEPGHFLPIRLPVDATDKPLVRTYTLSDADHGEHYRITVKREGVASGWLHDQLKPGMEIEARTPGGAFTLDRSSTRPVVLLSAGIGITPMIAMLNTLLADTSAQTRPEHIYFVHGARDANDHPFAAQLEAAERKYPNLSVHWRESRPVEAEEGVPTHRVGRVDIDFLKRILPFGDYDFYLCGPGAFMQDLYNGLRALNVADERIRFEAFGPASVKRSGRVGATSATGAIATAVEAAASAGGVEAPPAATVATAGAEANVSVEADNAATGTNAPPTSAETAGATAKVVFMKTQRDAQWSAKDGTLLEFAEANGVDAPSLCRSGICGTCSTRVLSGEVSYPTPCDFPVEQGHALICSAIPATTGMGEASTVVLDL